MNLFWHVASVLGPGIVTGVTLYKLLSRRAHQEYCRGFFAALDDVEWMARPGAHFKRSHEEAIAELRRNSHVPSRWATQAKGES